MESVPTISSAPSRAFLFALAVAVFMFGLAASSAHASTFAPTYDQTFSEQTAGFNSALTATITKDSTASNIKQITINESPQVGFSYPALGAMADQCPSSSMPLSTSPFNPASCPAQAKVGTVTLTSPDLSHTATGNVYLISKSQFPWLGVDINPTSAAGNPAGFTARFAFTTTFANVVPSCDPATEPSGHCDQYLKLASAQFPNLTLSNVDLNLNGPDRTSSTGGTLPGKLFSLKSTPCSSSLPTSVTFVPQSGSSTSVTDSDTLTGCVVAFNQTFSNPTAGSSSAATWDWSFPAQPSNLKMLRINESPDVSLNPAGLGTQFCSPTAWPTLTSPFDPSLCPPGAKIGSFTIKSPSYSAPATGDVYIIAPTGSLGLPKIGVDVRPTTAPGNPAGVNVNFGFTMSLPQQDPTCDVATDPNGFCQQIYSFLGRGLPDVSISQAKLTFTNQIFTVGGAGCQSPIFTSVAMFTPISGSSSSIVDADPISGC